MGLAHCAYVQRGRWCRFYKPARAVPWWLMPPIPGLAWGPGGVGVLGVRPPSGVRVGGVFGVQSLGCLGCGPDVPMLGALGGCLRHAGSGPRLGV
jgi:hypothetical protein